MSCRWISDERVGFESDVGGWRYQVCFVIVAVFFLDERLLRRHVRIGFGLDGDLVTVLSRELYKKFFLSRS